MMKILLVVLAVALLAAVALGLWLHARDQGQMHQAWAALAAAREADPPPYDPAMVAGLPALAQRYFARSIAPGTPLHRVVQLEMEGEFVLNGKTLPMAARQVLAPPARGFVWQAQIGAGWLQFGGSDGYLRESASGQSWTRFWLRGLVPLARVSDTQDHARAAATRVMMESVWTPAALLPQFGARWTQTGPLAAEVRFDQTPGLPPMRLHFDEHGDPVEVVALRWTDANPEKVYRLQPFGGRLLAFASHQGFRIPVQVEMGNLFGTPDYAPFFLARVTGVRY